MNQETKEEANKKDTESDLKGDVDKNTDNGEYEIRRKSKDQKK